MDKQGILYIVATPIGNLEDVTLRALRVLREVDLILCEDTRVTKKLLSHYDIKTRTDSYHAQSKTSKIKKIINLLMEEKNIALVSDSGTPTISDPGVQLVNQVRGVGVRVEVIPGPSALIAALSISGIPSSDFLFLGFLPHKKGRETLFKEITNSKRTVVFYESPHRLLKTLDSLKEKLVPKRKVVIAKELTKIYEEIFSGTAKEAFNYFEEYKDKVRGEFVVIVEGAM